MTPISPSEPIDIVRTLKDPSDTSTYYVQALIRRSTDGSTITTIKLAFQATRFYSTRWLSFATPGTQFIITTKVFTDSGYTTQSLNYEEESQGYKIQFIPTAYPFVGGGGGSGGGEKIDYGKIRTIVEEIETEHEKEEKEILPFNYAPIFSGFELLAVKFKNALDSIERKIPVFKETDLSKVHQGIDKVYKAITAIPPQKNIDFTEVMDTLSSLHDSLEEAKEKIEDTKKSMQEKSFITFAMPQEQKKVKSLWG